MATNDLSTYPLLVLVLLLSLPPLVVLALLARRRARANGRESRQQLRLPPGPWAIPVIGHLHHLAPPHRALRDLARSYGPLMTLNLRNIPVVVATSPAAAREVTMTHDVAFASRPLSPALRLLRRGAAADGVTFAPYGDAWRQMRRVCTLALFTSPRVRSFRAVREDELARLLRSVVVAEAGAPLNLTRLISRFLFDSSARAVAGSRSQHREEFLRMLQEALRSSLPKLSLLDFFPPPSRLATLVASYVIVRRRAAVRGPIVPHLDAILDSIIQEHLERKRSARDDDAAAGVQDDEEEDLVDVLLRLQKDMDSEYPFTTLNIKSVIMDLFVAGSETSATALQWAMINLMRNPSVMKKAQDEVRTALAGQSKVTEDDLSNLHYLRLVIKETLRLYPPAPVLLRECRRRSGCQVLGYHVPQGAMVLVNAWAIGRDPAHWGDAAEEFVPERWFQFEHGGGGRDFKGADLEYVPFGAGRRMCPGMAFGLAHVELALAALLFHFDWALPEGMAVEEMDMVEAAGLTMPPRSDLLLVAIPRVPLPLPID